MKTPRVLFAVATLTLSLTAGHAAAAPEREPGEKSKGKLYQWTGDSGLTFQYVVPRSYEPQAGATLTVILHGSGLDHRWGFANHKAGDFRSDDIVVSPDGTTPNSRGSFDFLGRPQDAEKFTAFLDEIRSTFNITAVYLYGHSQGSFFALYYAGLQPEAINGVLAHASGVWTQTRLAPAGHHQAIVLMHGTSDPIVPFTQSLGGYNVYRDKGYPNVRLRALEGWNHMPAEHNGAIPHASQQLAWIEAMTSDDLPRLTTAYATLAKPKDKTQHDFAALYQVAQRLGGLTAMPDRAREASARTAANVVALAEQHAASIKLPDLSADPSPEPDGSPWIGHLPMFLRAFASVPPADALATRLQPVLEAHDQAASESFTSYWAAVNAKDPKAAFVAGLAAMRNAYLSVRTHDPRFVANMKKWSGDRSLEISKEDLKSYKNLTGELADSQKKGRADFESINKRARL